MVGFILASVAATHSMAAEWPMLRGIDESRFMHAIAVVENSEGRIGAAGERTRWQICQSTWREHCNQPMATAPEALQREVALRIVRHFAHILRQRGIPVTVRSLAMAWNGGPRAYRYLPSTKDYAQRVVNVYLQ